MRLRPKAPSPRDIRTFIDDRRGAAAIVMAILTPVLIGGLAFGAEVGYWELEKRQLQNAVDTGAHAAGTQLRMGVTDDATLETVAQAIAAAGGFEGSSTEITLTQPPASGAYAGNAQALNVVLTQEIPRRFSGIYDHTPIVINVDATALVGNGRPACVLALNRTAASAINTGGSTNATLTGCDIATNSTSSSAVGNTGNGNSVTAACISAVGNVGNDPNYHLTCAAPISNGPLTIDPYANIPLPTAADCFQSNTAAQFTQNGNPSTPGTGQNNRILCYSGAGAAWTFPRSINLTSNNTYVLFNTHATQSATFGVGGNNTVTGTNVTVILVGKWSVAFNGNTRLSLTARTSGAYSGIALFADRANQIDVDISGNNAGKIVGAIYSGNQNSLVTYTGSGTAYTTGQCTQVIGGKVKFYGNSTLTTDCSNSGTSAILSAQTVRLVE
jgi:Flp pilus assembly protein TadG